MQQKRRKDSRLEDEKKDRPGGARGGGWRNPDLECTMGLLRMGSTKALEIGTRRLFRKSTGSRGLCDVQQRYCVVVGKGVERYSEAFCLSPKASPVGLRTFCDVQQRQTRSGSVILETGGDEVGSRRLS